MEEQENTDHGRNGKDQEASLLVLLFALDLPPARGKPAPRTSLDELLEQIAALPESEGENAPPRFPAFAH